MYKGLHVLSVYCQSHGVGGGESNSAKQETLSYLALICKGDPGIHINTQQNRSLMATTCVPRFQLFPGQVQTYAENCPCVEI